MLKQNSKHSVRILKKRLVIKYTFITLIFIIFIIHRITFHILGSYDDSDILYIYVQYTVHTGERATTSISDYIYFYKIEIQDDY